MEWLDGGVCASLVFIDSTKLLSGMVVLIDLHCHRQEMWVPIVLHCHKCLVLSDFLISASLMKCLSVALICIALVTGWSDMNGVPQRHEVPTPGTCDYYLIG